MIVNNCVPSADAMHEGTGAAMVKALSRPRPGPRRDSTQGDLSHGAIPPHDKLRAGAGGGQHMDRSVPDRLAISVLRLVAVGHAHRPRVDSGLHPQAVRSTPIHGPARRMNLKRPTSYTLGGLRGVSLHETRPCQEWARQRGQECERRRN